MPGLKLSRRKELKGRLSRSLRNRCPATNETFLAAWVRLPWITDANRRRPD